MQPRSLEHAVGATLVEHQVLAGEKRVVVAAQRVAVELQVRPVIQSPTRLVQLVCVTDVEIERSVDVVELMNLPECDVDRSRKRVAYLLIELWRELRLTSMN